MLKGFKDFIMRGNVVDLAVAVIIAGAFGKVIEAFVTVIMDLVGKLGGSRGAEDKDMPWVHPGNGPRTPPLQSFEESLAHQNPLKVLYFENSRRRRPFQCCHDRTEIDCTFSNSRMAVFPAIVIMDMHM